jgi:F0F1-type ATP synthase delta subunit
MTMEQAYAQALMRAVENGMTPHAAVKAVKEMLERDGRTALLPRVARAFARLAERQSKKDDIVLTVAREKDERQAKSAAKEILAELNADMDGLKTQVDDSIIGGWRLEGRGMLVDNSYKSKLLDIYHMVTK